MFLLSCVCCLRIQILFSTQIWRGKKNKENKNPGILQCHFLAICMNFASLERLASNFRLISFYHKRNVTAACGRKVLKMQESTFYKESSISSHPRDGCPLASAAWRLPRHLSRGCSQLSIIAIPLCLPSDVLPSPLLIMLSASSPIITVVFANAIY